MKCWYCSKWKIDPPEVANTMISITGSPRLEWGTCTFDHHLMFVDMPAADHVGRANLHTAASFGCNQFDGLFEVPPERITCTNHLC